jgi:hypothetical protein
MSAGPEGEKAAVRPKLKDSPRLGSTDLLAGNVGDVTLAERLEDTPEGGASTPDEGVSPPATATDREDNLARSDQPYVPTPAEVALAADVLRYRSKVPPTRLRLDDDGNHVLEVTHTDREVGNLVFMASLGTREMPFLDGLINQIGSVGLQRRGGPEVVDFLLSAVKGIEPKDQIEAMLATQMGAVHLATMHMAGRVMAAQTVEARESAERSFNRLARTFATQTETLKRYRTGGEQKVTVQHQHVTVNEGGQAVVGNVSHGGRGRKKNER